MNKFLLAIVYCFATIGFVLVIGHLAITLGLTNTAGVIDEQRGYFKEKMQEERVPPARVWASTEEWRILREAIRSDAEPLLAAARASGVPARLIAAILVVEQLRLYGNERELFKTVFAPLKILGNQSQFSWGVMGLKQETARKIENNLRNPRSPWYLGEDAEHILDFTTENPDQGRFERLTDAEDRYYSYLYAGLLLRQLAAQWENAGFPIEGRTEIIATLFNIGFENSTPHANPRSGGAEIKIGSEAYSFGRLAKSFYDSDELTDIFPRPY